MSRKRAYHVACTLVAWSAVQETLGEERCLVKVFRMYFNLLTCSSWRCYACWRSNDDGGISGCVACSDYAVEYSIFQSRVV